MDNLLAAFFLQNNAMYITVNYDFTLPIHTGIIMQLTLFCNLQ